jgi:hypothetical protein
MSATYRQSSQASADASKKDPENQLLSHQNMTRLTAEMIRDAMLTSNGKLNRQMYGRPTFPEIPRQAILNTQNSIEYTWPVNVDPDSHNRRSIYLVVKRTIPVPMMNLFDAPDGSFSCDKRSHATIPTQSLALMNSPFTVAESGFLAEQLLKTEGIDREGMIRQAFLSTLSRQPTENELSQSVNFLTESGATTPLDGRKLAEFCHVLFMTNEFIYLN